MVVCENVRFLGCTVFEYLHVLHPTCARDRPMVAGDPMGGWEILRLDLSMAIKSGHMRGDSTTCLPREAVAA